MEAAPEASHKLQGVKVEEHTSEPGEANKVLKMEMAAQKRNDTLRLRFMQRIIDKQEYERKRISRDIHDHLGREMTALSIQLQLLKERFGKDIESTVLNADSAAKYVFVFEKQSGLVFNRGVNRLEAIFQRSRFSA